MERAEQVGHGLPRLADRWVPSLPSARPPSSGQMGNVHLSQEAEAYFAKKGCKVLLQPTPDATHVFNRSHAKKIGLFHVTC